MKKSRSGVFVKKERQSTSSTSKDKSLRKILHRHKEM